MLLWKHSNVMQDTSQQRRGLLHEIPGECTWRGCEKSHSQWTQSLKALVDQPAGVWLCFYLSVCLSVEMSRTLPSLGFSISTVPKEATHNRNGIPATRGVKYYSLKTTFTGILLQCTMAYKRLTRSKFIMCIHVLFLILSLITASRPLLSHF